MGHLGHFLLVEGGYSMPKSRHQHKRHTTPRPRRDQAERCPVCGGHIIWTRIAPNSTLHLSRDALRRLAAGELVVLPDDAASEEE